MPTEISSVYALWLGLNLLLTLGLGLNVTRYRFKQAKGEASEDRLQQAIRAHGNNIEYVPFALLALGVLALLGCSEIWIHGFGGTLFVARIFHAYGLQLAEPALPKSRLIGNFLTWLVMIVMGIMLIASAF